MDKNYWIPLFMSWRLSCDSSEERISDCLYADPPYGNFIGIVVRGFQHNVNVNNRITNLSLNIHSNDNLQNLRKKLFILFSKTWEQFKLEIDNGN